MNARKKVTCIIPVYNEARRIHGPIQAALDCALVDEVIVINDASTDNTKDVLQKMKRVTAIHLEKNMGIAYALQRGARAASGEILVFLDSDLIGLQEHHICDLVQPVIDNPNLVTMSLRQNSLFVFRLVGMDFITGEKAISKKLFLSLPSVEDSRYGFVLYLNDLLLKRKTPIISVDLKGVIHPTKIVKRGLVKGFIGEVKMIYEMSKVMNILAMCIQCAQMALIASKTQKSLVYSKE